jgi:hypothetical protein
MERGGGEVATADAAFAHAAAEAGRAGLGAKAAIMRFRRGHCAAILGDVPGGLTAMSRALQELAQTPATEAVSQLRADLERFEQDLATAAARTRPLDSAPRLLLELICAVHRSDRASFVVRPIFSALWRQGCPSAKETDFDTALGALAEAGLVRVVSIEQGPADQEYVVDDRLSGAVQAQTTSPRKTAIANQLIEAWRNLFVAQALAPSKLAVRAGCAAAVYLRRAGRFDESFELSDRVLAVARRTGETSNVLPHLYLAAFGATDPRIAPRLDSLGGQEGV